MDLETFEYDRTECEHTHRQYPEISRRVKILPEPGLVYERFPVSFNYIVHGIEFEYDPEVFGKCGDIP